VSRLSVLIRRCRREEDGVAMVVAIGALSVLLVLSGVAFSSSSVFNQSSNVDRSARGAFQSAEAGLDVATYRINNLVPLGGEELGCVPSVEQEQSDGSCEANGQVADGATWSYEVTPELDEDNYEALLPGGKCAGFPIAFDAGEDLTLRSRCITAMGTSNGVTRRVQARLALFTGTSDGGGGTQLFPVGGIIGLDGVTIKNSGKIYASIASNGLVDMQNASFVTGAATLGPGAPAPSLGNNSRIGPDPKKPAVTYRTPAQGPWVLAPVDIGNTATVHRNGTGIGWTLSNGAQVTYNATYREAEFNNGKVTLLGGDYNFCKLTMNNSTEFYVATGAKVRIFIDSPTRAGSGCRSGTGTFTVKNSFKLMADEATAQIQIYVYGGDVGGKPAVDINNSSEFHALIHAPLASIEFKNSMKFYGAINAKRVEFKNASDFYFPTNGISGLTPNTQDPQETMTLFQRSAWRECKSEPSVAGNVHSGC
jgi:hypothetical protein